MKVTIYTREHSTRKLNRAKAKFYDAGTVFVLRYKKTFETLGAVSFIEAQQKAMEKALELHKGRIQYPKPVNSSSKPTELMLDVAIDEYLTEIQQQRKPKTHAAYSVALRYFYASCGNKPVKDVSRGDMLNFALYLREVRAQGDRSAANKFENVLVFIKRHGITAESLKITAHDRPQYVLMEPEIYEQEKLDRFFEACTEDELLIFEFFLMTGMREQEVIYCSDKSLNFEACTISVKYSIVHRWQPKAYKERTIPVPPALMDKLKVMLTQRGKDRELLFPTANGQPKFDFLDMCKAIAKRAGLDPSEFWLHKFRATFATRSLWAGFDLRTVQAWLGHSDLASTMRYLKPNRHIDKDAVSRIWAKAVAI